MSDAFAALVRQALQGTARQPDAPPLPVPLHEIVAGQPDASSEARLLLAAGAAAVYATAGRLPQDAPTLPEAAREDHRPPCPPAVARLIGDFLAGRHADLLPEALTLLRGAGMRLPPHLLSLALGYRDTALRPALAAVLGERGRWLAAFNPDWQWALDARPAAPDDAALAAAWQEGTAERRLSAIRRLRQVAPAQARAWVAATWSQEKAEFRADLVRALEINLSYDDEPFLKAALDDRGPSVREQAARLLARLPTSAYARRMAKRAAALLSVEVTPALTGLLPDGGPAPRLLRLAVTPPSSVDAAWERDGVGGPLPERKTTRGWQLRRVLAAVDPAFWEERFAARPTELVAAVDNNDWAAEVLQAWTAATLIHQRAAWAEPLWRHWHYDTPPEARPDGWHELLSVMPQAVAERCLLALLQEATEEDARDVAALLTRLPEPWSETFGHAYLLELRRRVEALSSKPARGAVGALRATLQAAALRLPPACFAAALRPWELPEEDDRVVDHWRQGLKFFTTTIDLRRQLWEGLRCSP